MDETPITSAAQPGVAKSQPEKIESEAPFYDIMPKTEAAGQIIGPKIQVEQPAKEPSAAGNFMAFLGQHKVLVIVILAILMLAYPAYYALNKFVLKPVEEESLLNEEAVKNLEKGSNAEKEYTTPDDWQLRFFGEQTCELPEKCGDEADPDQDGLKNLEEYNKNTDPNNADSDQDGLADGDEVNVFDTDPGKKSTIDDPAYDDGQYIKGGYNPKVRDTLFTTEEIQVLNEKMESNGLHVPTPLTLGDSLSKIYSFMKVANEINKLLTTPKDLASSTPDSSQPATSTTVNALAGFDLSAEAKQDRDTQRSMALKTVAIALDKYFEDKGAYPQKLKFEDMYAQVKPYIKVATKPVDPINKDKYVYVYTPSEDGEDFTLTFYSETQDQIIKINAKTAAKYRAEEEAAIFDDQRKTHLETIRSALLLYSANNAGGNQDYVFPSVAALQTSLVPQFIGEIPKDPKTDEAYNYEVSESFDSFTLKTYLDNPPTGRSGYMCNQEECRYY